MNDWLRRAACRVLTPEESDRVFYPHRGRAVALYAEARQWCVTCPVQRDCLDNALAEEGTAWRDNRFGFRGGLTPAERARVSGLLRSRT